jgi:hypothetical protein
MDISRLNILFRLCLYVCELTCETRLDKFLIHKLLGCLALRLVHHSKNIVKVVEKLFKYLCFTLHLIIASHVLFFSFWWPFLIRTIYCFLIILNYYEEFLIANIPEKNTYKFYIQNCVYFHDKSYGLLAH